MKVVCIKSPIKYIDRQDRPDKVWEITEGKIYDVIWNLTNGEYIIKCDDGMKYSILMEYFIPLDEYRSEQLNKILES